MGTDPDRDSFQTGGDYVGNDRAPWQNERERTRPILCAQSLELFSDGSIDDGHFVDSSRIGKVNDEWVKTRPIFRGKNFNDGAFIQRIRG